MIDGLGHSATNRWPSLRRISRIVLNILTLGVPYLMESARAIRSPKPSGKPVPVGDLDTHDLIVSAVVNGNGTANGNGYAHVNGNGNGDGTAGDALATPAARD